MIKTALLKGTILIGLIYACSGCGSTVDSAKRTKPSVDDSRAKLFAPGVISDGHAYGISFSRDMKIAYFTYKEKANDTEFIYTSESVNGNWTKPEVASFSGKYEEFDPNISPDFKYMFIMTSRPQQGTVPKDDFDIWYLENDGTNWVNPKPLGPKVNSETSEGVVAMTLDGWIYYFSSKEGGYGQADIYQARFNDGQISEVQNVGPKINTKYWDGHNCISPDGKVMVFYSNSPEGSLGLGDLYVTYKVDGEWTNPENLGSSVNSEMYEITPSFSPDMKYLYFGRIHTTEPSEIGSAERNIWYIPIEETPIKLR